MNLWLKNQCRKTLGNKSAETVLCKVENIAKSGENVIGTVLTPHPNSNFKDGCLGVRGRNAMPHAEVEFGLDLGYALMERKEKKVAKDLL